MTRTSATPFDYPELGSFEPDSECTRDFVRNLTRYLAHFNAAGPGPDIHRAARIW